MRGCKRPVVLALLLLPLTALQAAQGDDDLPPIQPGSAATVEQPSKATRLKFRRGPTCMCATGTSEEEIRQAEEARRSSAAREK